MANKIIKKISDYLCIASKDDVARSVRAFSLKQKATFGVCAILAFSGIWYVFDKLNAKILIDVPVRGGSFAEGVVGVPRFVNPLLAVSDVDRDLTSLVYSGLVRIDERGTIIPDLARDYSVSSDGLEYTFTLRDGLKWQDGQPLLVDDILFTIQKIQDPAIRSSRIGAWQKVSIETTGTSTIVFRLKKPYPQFLENAVIGILPKHLWEGVRPEAFQFSTLNVSPIGSGPYKISDMTEDKNGMPESYSLVPFEDFALGSPYISKITVNFYSSEDAAVAALKKGKIDTLPAVSPEIAKGLAEEGYSIERTTLPRIFAVFFNQSRNRLLLRPALRNALDLAVDKKGLVDTVLYGFADSADGPIPHGSLGWSELKDKDSGVDKAKEILEKDNWIIDSEKKVLTHVDSPATAAKKATKKAAAQPAKPAVTTDLELTITTADKPELMAVAEFVAEAWRNLGAVVTVRTFEIEDLKQTIVKPRAFDALLFGEVVGRDPDLYSFWDSSQRIDPGLNIAQYVNAKVDKLIAEAQASVSPAVRMEKLSAAQDEIRKDYPAVFLYSPQFLYVVPNYLHKKVPLTVLTSSDRFCSVYSWYIETEKIWKIFKKNQ